MFFVELVNFFFFFAEDVVMVLVREFGLGLLHLIVFHFFKLLDE